MTMNAIPERSRHAQFYIYLHRTDTYCSSFLILFYLWDFYAPVDTRLDRAKYRAILFLLDLILISLNFHSVTRGVYIVD
jgi:hypothetical protein